MTNVESLQLLPELRTRGKGGWRHWPSKRGHLSLGLQGGFAQGVSLEQNIAVLLLSESPPGSLPSGASWEARGENAFYTQGLMGSVPGPGES